MKLKGTLGRLLAPLARHYIRYAPTNVGKTLLWKHVHWRSHEYVARTKFGTMMAGSSIDIVQGYIYYFGVWEPNLTAFILRRLRAHRDRTFVDVGANVGYFSLLAARTLGSGKVVAIEAFPSIFEKLQHNIALNGYQNIRAIQSAATSVVGDIDMFHAGAMNEGGTTMIPDKFKTAAVKVRGLPLADLLTEEELREALLIKIDVEGAEHDVLRGIRRAIKDFAHDVEFIVEVTPSYLGDEKLDEILDMFAAQGFMAYSLQNPYTPQFYLSRCTTIPPARTHIKPTIQTDLIFSRTDAEFL